MLPPPTTTATSTPRACTRRTCSAIAAIRSLSAPYSSGPISASPDSLRRMRAKAGSPPAAGSTSSRAISGASARPPPSGAFLAHLEAREAPDDDVLAGLRGRGGAQVLDRLAAVLVVVDVRLVEQHV